MTNTEKAQVEYDRIKGDITPEMDEFIRRLMRVIGNIEARTARMREESAKAERIQQLHREYEEG